jgi:hypothetical protein
MIIQFPVTTAMLEKNDDLCPSGKAESSKIIIEFDTRKRDYHKIFKLKRGVKIHWINEHAFDVQELSGFAWPIIYRITTADGYYLNEQGQRIYESPRGSRTFDATQGLRSGDAARSLSYALSSGSTQSSR